MSMPSSPATPVGPGASTVRRRMAASVEDLRAEAGHIWDVVIVGSGYGGAAAAASFAGLEVDGKKLSVCVLERGSEFLPGDFPSRFGDLPKHVRMSTDTGTRGQADGLFDMRIGKDVCALVGNGLGGGSLINAGVLVEPDPQEVDRLFSGKGDAIQTLKDGDWYTQALNVLGGQVGVQGVPTPNTLGRHPDASSIHKGKALATLSTNGADDVPVSVAMASERNSAGLQLNACTLCGDCMTGCNVGAKNSLDTNLLHTAHNAGARLFTGVSVLSVDQSEKNTVWVLRAVCTDPQRQSEQEGPFAIRARHVVLAAGALGSSEILLRSRSDRLPFSAELGAHFSCNGDSLAAFYDMPVPVNPSADEGLPITQRTVGPTITREIRVSADQFKCQIKDQIKSPNNGSHPAFRVQEFAVPAAVKRLFEEIVTTSMALHSVNRADCSPHGDEKTGTPDPLAVNPAAVHKTLLVGVIGHDEAKGVLQLDRRQGSTRERPMPGHVRIHWPDARHGPALEAADQVLQLWANSGGKGALLPNPLWKLLPGSLTDLVSQPRGPVLTVHPLGGCAWDKAAAEGVVNEFGQVYNPDTGQPYRGLAVLDGSVFGHSLGANPALTITAFALRAADHLAKTWWGIPAQPLGQTPAPGEPTAPRDPPRTPEEPVPPFSPLPDTRVQVIERMLGEADVCLNGKKTRCMLEMTLAFEPVGLRSMSMHWGRQLHLIAEEKLPLGPDQQPAAVRQLAVYDLDEWSRHHLKQADDATREPYQKAIYSLTGHMRLLERGRSWWGMRLVRAGWAWFCNRGVHEVGDALLRGLRSLPVLGRWLSGVFPSYSNEAPVTRTKVGFFKRLVGLLQLATRAGERRHFHYKLEGQSVKPRKAPVVGAVTGVKTLTYNRRANPWQQLMRMELRAMPGLVVERRRFPVLELDTAFLAGQGLPLMRITRQTQQADALLDMVSFGLYMTRLLMHIHLWTFRRSDQAAPKAVERLPGAIRGQAQGEWVQPEVTELTVDHIRQAHGALFPKGMPVNVRLTRYPHRKSSQPALVFIHGYSVSGNTFTHPSIPVSAAEHFWKLGRDVWVLDLRTSTGMPTCTYPWSMEQVALIDIPAALHHVRQLSGKPVDVIAHCMGGVMLSMAMLTRPDEVRKSKVSLGVDDWLTNTHFGTLTAFHGSNQASASHPTVHRIVLSQKGPVLRYSDANIARAFIMQSQRRWLFNDVFRFQVSSGAGVAVELLDRLLASLPYPAADYATQNPKRPWRKTPWTQSRRRIDMLYGRVFSAENLHPDTLNAIDDLFGPMHMDTLAQTIHFARYSVITNQRGDGEFFSIDRLKERWTVANTLAIHGKHNGLVDVSTHLLLKDRFVGAGLPFEHHVFCDKGHQDVFIGKDNHKVYERIGTFLNASPQAVPAPAVPPLPTRPPLVWVSPPWLGPRIHMPPSPLLSLSVRATSRPDQGPARMVLLPVYQAPGDPPLTRGPVSAFLQTRQPLRAGRWHRLFLSLSFLQCVRAQAAGGPGELVWLALMVHEPGDVTYVPTQPAQPAPADGANNNKPAQTANGAISLPAPAFPQQNGPVAMVQLSTLGINPTNALFNDLQAWAQGATAETLASVTVRLSDIEQAYQLLQPQDRVSFSLGSCQYPPGLLDSDPAQASLREHQHHLANTTPDDPDNPRTQFAIFCGDQIYADASAGLADPVRRDERFQVPHERALRQPALRSVLQRIPSAMLLDDHEIRDNWAALPTDHPDRWSNLKQRDNALIAFYRYQRMQPIWAKTARNRNADQTLDWAGLPIYLLDTRSRREPRPHGMAAHIIDAHQRQKLAAWLIQHRHLPKCIVSPSLLLPRRKPHLSGTASDAFDGYPHTMHWLLDLLITHDIRHTLFLSGDEHHSFVCEASLSDTTRSGRTQLVSIHSSALYAPYPFANGRLDDLNMPDHFDIGAKGTRKIKVSTRLLRAEPGDGFARIEVDRDRCEVRVWFHRHGGHTSPPLVTGF